MTKYFGKGHAQKTGRGFWRVRTAGLAGVYGGRIDGDDNAFFYYHFETSDWRRAMPELGMKPSDIGSRELSSREEPVSMAERELLAFLETATDLAGPDSKGYLTEIWLDELACMECMPEPSSSDWRLVTDAAVRRLARQMMENNLSQPRIGRGSADIEGEERSADERKASAADFSCILSVSARIY